MLRFIPGLIVAALVCGIFLFDSIRVADAQKSKPRSFFIESQPDSPLLIRELTATILPRSKYRNEPEIEVELYIENTSKKKVRTFYYGSRAADGSDEGKLDEGMSFSGNGDLLPGELKRAKFTHSVKGVSIIYRIGRVYFEDYTEWKAKPFNAAKAKKSAPIIATKQKQNAETVLGRILTREWTVPVFGDRVKKTLKGRSQVIEGVTVQTKIHYIEREYLTDVEFCNVELDESEKPSAEALAMMSGGPAQAEKVESFTTYEINDRVFAYSIPYESVEAETGKDIGVGFENIYVDEDGSGIFKLYCKERDLKILPQWVKALSEK